jgi:sugar phosphate isomerase/epimerase
MIRFGTTTLPLTGWLADPQRPTESRELRLHAMRQIVEHHGLQAVELTLDLQAIYPQVFDAGFYASVADLQQELGFTCTVHLPFLWVEPASLNETIRQASLSSLRQAVEITRSVGVHSYVLHLWGLTTGLIVSQLQDPAQQQAVVEILMWQASRSLAALCEIVDPEAVCIENLEDSLCDLALPIVEQHGASICLDVGHLALQGGSELDFLEQHRETIREIHLHDALVPTPGAKGRASDHLALGQGQLDVEALLQRLEEMEFDGPIILEVNSRTDLERSLEYLKPHL